MIACKIRNWHFGSFKESIQPLEYCSGSSIDFDSMKDYGSVRYPLTVSLHSVAVPKVEAKGCGDLEEISSHATPLICVSGFSCP